MEGSWYDIDSPVDAIQVNATNYYPGSRLTSDQWLSLPEDAKKVWDMLSQEAKAITLKPRPPSAPNPGGRRPFPPRRGDHLQMGKPRSILMKLRHSLHLFITFMGGANQTTLMKMMVLMVSFQLLKRLMSNTLC